MKRNEERDARKGLRDKNFEKTQKKKENYSRFASKTREPKRKKERKKERKGKERANATTRIIILSIAQYHHHLLCASVIFHYSN